MYSRAIPLFLTAVLVGLGSLVVAAPASAVPVTDTDTAGIKYLADSDDPGAGATVTGYTGTADTVTIPGTVTINGTDYSVTTIGDAAFYRSTLKAVTIPDSVITIGEDAFANNALEAVVIPDSVTTIDEGAFAVNALEAVTIPDSLTTIGAFVFDSNALEAVVIPASITTIGAFAFRDNALEAVTIPASVTTIGEGAFDSNALEAVVIPASVTTIGTSAFSNNALEAVTIPDSATTIGAFVFADNALEAVTIPASVTAIGVFAFANNALEAVTIPASVTAIGRSAFASNALEAVVIPASVTAIGDYAFGSNDSLATVKFVGAPPTTFTGAGEDGSFGDSGGLVVTYPWAYEQSNVEGGFTTPTWRGYNTQASITVAFDLGGHGTAIPGRDVLYGETATAPTDPVAAGWTFNGWFTDPEATAAYDFSTPVDGELTLYAGWAAVPPSMVTFDMGGHGNAVPALDVPYGETATAPADPVAAGWTFNGWFIDAETTTVYDFSTPITGDLTLYAGWAAVPPSMVTFDMGGHANAIPALDVPYGETATAPVDPVAAGWTFTGWFTDAQATTAHDFGTVVSDDLTLYAGWVVVPPSMVTFDAGGHGTAIPALDVPYGETATAPADPVSAGWTFTGWFTDAEATAVYDFSSPVDGDLILYAGWTEIVVPDPVPGPAPELGSETTDEQVLARTGSPLTGPLLAIALTVTVAGAILIRRRA